MIGGVLVSGNKLEWELIIKNVGPHTQTVLKDISESLRMGIYADNGAGKTFISRAFEGLQKQSDKAYIKRLVQKGKKQGNLSFSIQSNENVLEAAKVNFINNNEYQIESSPHYIYHVYNRDYVKRNLEILGYNPTNNILGIVLGKERIDLSKEKEELFRLKNEGIVLKKELETAFEESRKHLKKEVKVNAATAEYKNFTLEQAEKNKLRYGETESYRSLRQYYWEFSNLPDEVGDIPPIHFKTDEKVLDECVALLKQSYTKSFFEHEFKQDIKERRLFIEEGVTYYDEEKCPFCKQTLGEKAQVLIHKYTVYLEDEENKILVYINGLQERLIQLGEEIEQFCEKEYRQTKREYNGIAQYFRETTDFPEIVIVMGVMSAIKKMGALLEQKKNDISMVIDEREIDVEVIKKQLEKIHHNIIQANYKIQIMNTHKNSNDKRKLALRKQICRAAYDELLNSLAYKMEQLEDLRKDYMLLDNQIKEKEYIHRTSKKQLVALTFKQLLPIFFGDKYTFNEDTFSMQYTDENLNRQADEVLSEGEKEVMAFCYYLASVHTLVDIEEQYEKIFLIIDSPVAQMDEHYSRLICQILTQLEALYCVSQPMSYIVLSHNLSFMNRLMAEKCIEKIYGLQSKKSSLMAEIAATTL